LTRLLTRVLKRLYEKAAGTRMFEERKDKAEEERIGGMDEWEEARTVK
jgi:hypothetical protein